jgi:RNA polymerase sigma factor (TIGR02999 family)
VRLLYAHQEVPKDAENITDLLVSYGRGDKESLDKLMPVVYDELRRQAARYLRREQAGHTLQTTALIHEAYVRLVDQRNVQWQNRAHFFGIAAQMMRRILVDHARTKKRAKRGGSDIRVSLDDATVAVKGQDLDVVAVDEALTRLEKIDEQQSRVVELRFFSGLTVEETAEVMGISPATVKREWSMARAWLHRELSGDR